MVRLVRRSRGERVKVFFVTAPSICAEIAVSNLTAKLTREAKTLTRQLEAAFVIAVRT